MTSRRPSDSSSTHHSVGDPVNGINESTHSRDVNSHETAYQDGYAQGRVSEQEVQYERDRASESEGISGGIFLGILLAALVGIGIAVYSYSARNNEPTSTPTTSTTTAPSPVVPQSQNTAPSQTTIIEKTRELVPVVPKNDSPNINIQVPPSPQSQPSAATSAPPASVSPTVPESGSSTGRNATENNAPASGAQSSDSTGSNSVAPASP